MSHRVASCILSALLAWVAPMQAARAQAATVTVQDDAIVFSGRIDHRAVAEFQRVLEADPKITRLIITSRGGLVAPALDMAGAVRDRQLDVEVPEDCLSSCANYVFPAGRRKTLGWPGAVAWHGNMTHVLYLQQSGQASWSDELMADARQLARREATFFLRIGVDGFVCWFAKLPPYDAEHFYYLGVPDMEKFGIHDVTVRNGFQETPEAAGLRLIAVDWERLENSRPVVKLED